MVVELHLLKHILYFFPLKFEDGYINLLSGGINKHTQFYQQGYFCARYSVVV